MIPGRRSGGDGCVLDFCQLGQRWRRVVTGLCAGTDGPKAKGVGLAESSAADQKDHQTTARRDFMKEISSPNVTGEGRGSGRGARAPTRAFGSVVEKNPQAADNLGEFRWKWHESSGGDVSVDLEGHHGAGIKRGDPERHSRVKVLGTFRRWKVGWLNGWGTAPTSRPSLPPASLQ